MNRAHQQMSAIAIMLLCCAWRRRRRHRLYRRRPPISAMKERPIFSYRSWKLYSQPGKSSCPPPAASHWRLMQPLHGSINPDVRRSLQPHRHARSLLRAKRRASPFFQLPVASLRILHQQDRRRSGVQTVYRRSNRAAESLMMKYAGTPRLITSATSRNRMSATSATVITVRPANNR